MIYIGTHYVERDELAYGLYELNFKTPDQRARHRYQIIVVKRGDSLAEYRKDLGAVSKFKGCDQIRIPSFFVLTVAELMDIAEKVRHTKFFDKKELVKAEKINE